jgi:hypothetical protein
VLWFVDCSLVGRQLSASVVDGAVRSGAIKSRGNKAALLAVVVGPCMCVCTRSCHGLQNPSSVDVLAFYVSGVRAEMQHADGRDRAAQAGGRQATGQYMDTDR